MWALVQKETKNSKAPLDLGVASALKRMWKVEEGGAHTKINERKQ
jgi:hypothetical protein